jgi:hypothetical protein
MLHALQPTEHDFQEFKGSAWVWDAGQIADQLHPRLSKQVGAFSNGAGGRLFLGIDDNGRPDGGIPTQLKGGTRAWLEDLVREVVEPKLARYNVFEVTGGGPGSAIQEGCAVYVLELPPSADSPHMSLDHRYYLRIAGKSQPMSHLHLLDILRRRHDPRVEVSRCGPYGPAEEVTDDPRGLKYLIGFRVHLINRGRSLARHVGVEVVLPRPLVSSDVRRRLHESPEFTPITQRPGSITAFRYHPAPVFPSQEVYALHAWFAVHGGNVDALRGGAELVWRVYADHAPPAIGSVTLASWGVVREATQRLLQAGLRPDPRAQGTSLASE